MLSAALPLLLAVVPLKVDKAAHSVVFTARATAVETNTTVEFAFVGPGSDRAYEAMFVTDASIAEIAKAFDEAGIPRGNAVGQIACRFWPAGRFVTIEPSIWDFISDETGKNNLPIVYSAGERDAADMPVANTNMPSAVFAMYGLGQSLLLLDDAIDQSAVYGRFKSNGKAINGNRYSFKVAWDGASGTESRRLVLNPGKAHEAIASLKGTKRELDVMPVFSPELTVAEAKAIAMSLAAIDSRAVKINGHAEDQFFYQGFLPDEKWRDRAKRLTQPLEIRLSASNEFYTVIDEDWSVEGDDPKLTPHDVSFDEVKKVFKGDAALVYASRNERLGRIYAIVRKLSGSSIRNWYVYID